MITLQTADKALKSAYLDVIAEQINFKTSPFLAKIKQTTENVWGKDVRQVIHYGMNGGVGVGDEAGDLPQAGGNMYGEIAVPLKNIYGTIEISDKAVRASENSSGAFVNLLNAEMDGLVKSSTLNLSRMIYGESSGLLSKIESQSGVNCASTNDVKSLVEGMSVDIYRDGSIIHSNIRITRIDRELREVAFNKNISVANKDEIYMQGSKGKELIGLKELFDVNKPIYGLSREENPWLIPHIYDGVGSLTEMDIQKVIDYLEDAYGSTVDIILCSSGVRRAFINHLSTFKRNLDYMELNAGFKALSYNGIPIIADRFCPDSTMYLLNSKDFVLHQLCDWKWLEGEDGRVLKQVGDKPVYKATLVKYAELICSRPCGQAVLKNIIEN